MDTINQYLICIKYNEIFFSFTRNKTLSYLKNNKNVGHNVKY